MVRYRSTAMSQSGMVASSHPLSTLAGAKVLMEGGNAFDAAIATNSVLNVTQPHLCGIGGDAFFLLFDSKRGKVEFLNASGRASRNASVSYYEDRKISSIPARGVLGAIEVPGCVHGWFEVHKRYGTLPISRLLQDSIRLARGGFPVSHYLSESIYSASKIFGEYREWMKIYNRDGNPPKPGDILRQTDLAWSLEQIAKTGAAAFYTGDISNRIAESMNSHQGLIDEEDLATHASGWGEPSSVFYRGFKIYETSPNSQAITALIAFALLSRFDVKDMGFESTEYTRLMIEASRIAYGYRDRYITDIDSMTVKPSELLDHVLLEKDSLELREKLEGKDKLDSKSYVEKAKEDGDTTYYCIVDKDHNCVSCIQSLYFGFGSGFVPEGTGIILQNRGSYFSLNREHHNVLAPRKRTFHTLCASLTTKDDNPFLLFGSMGGDVQPQIHQQVISSVLDFGTDIQQAIEDPRWTKQGTIYESMDEIHFESRYSSKTISELKRLGYVIKMEQALWPSSGHAQGITIDSESGVLTGGADPRGDGLALGI
ncbi:MAG: gamma-glutamyltransferase [Nitrososphaerales archaeon]